MPSPISVKYLGAGCTIGHIGGIPWHDAPLPRRRHECTAQTLCYGNGITTERCACGAIRIGGHGWMQRSGWLERNSRRDA